MIIVAFGGRRTVSATELWNRDKTGTSLTTINPASKRVIASQGLMERSRSGTERGDTLTFGRVYVHIINSTMYRAITGNAPPASPIDAASYTAYGLPWFRYYRENDRELSPG
jgi:hypothetical protein